MATTIMISMRVNPAASFVFIQAFRVLVGIGAVVAVAVFDRFAPPTADETTPHAKSFAMTGNVAEGPSESVAAWSAVPFRHGVKQCADPTSRARIGAPMSRSIYPPSSLAT
jgi:hypothetical protein